MSAAFLRRLNLVTHDKAGIRWVAPPLYLSGSLSNIYAGGRILFLRYHNDDIADGAPSKIVPQRPELLLSRRSTKQALALVNEHRVHHTAHSCKKEAMLQLAVVSKFRAIAR